MMGLLIFITSGRRERTLQRKRVFNTITERNI
jgi:hypothetical protein